VYTICVFSTRSEDAARDYADRLTKAGYKASVIQAKLQSGAVGYRTVIGAFTDRKIGERQLAELKKKAQFRDAFLILK
jgi:cell division septation protein DedD